MGGKMQQLAEKLEAEGIEIRRSSEVVEVDDLPPGLHVLTRDGSEALFDFVVFATHPDALHAMVKESPLFAPTLPILEKLTYFRADIVLHRDSTLRAAEDPSFLNILVNARHEVYSSTMHLGVIDPRFEGLYKSWLPAEKTAELKAAGLYLADRSFYHPLITCEFVEQTKALQALEQTLHLKGFAIAGGWTQGMETQETAVISGQKAAEAYLRYVRAMTPAE
jgi:predicted NAD/FAD-binding protein